jgi:dolichyl-phosphate-mannose--protein O-mannosyl transferase
LAIGAMTVAKKSKVFKEGWWFLVSSYFLVWAPWLLSPRIMFYYHYTPAIPFLAIALAIWLSRLWENGSSGKMIAATILELTILSFILFLPLWIGTPISREYADYFFWLPTWR